ncbi:MAG: NAD-dependent epimerase/dehydratase family protein [Chloroflexi bacterium]|nr:MAG: NAD-dependent epimerase/dehydratase family protein [Chloroflexota bacterium]
MNSVSPNLVSLATKRIAVTGGAGFIGSHTVDRLLAAGVDVLVIDDQSHPSPEPPATETLTADCGSEEAAEALARFKPSAVLHLASKGGVQVAARDPAGHARRSLESTIALYDAAIKAGAKRLVSASSGGTVYGDSKKLPAPETARAAPLSAYGAAKRSEEVYLAALGKRHGISTLAPDARLHVRRRRRRRQRRGAQQPAVGRGERGHRARNQRRRRGRYAHRSLRAGNPDRDGPRQGIRGQASLPGPAPGGTVARLAPESRHRPGPGNHVRVVRGPKRPALTAGDRMNSRKVELTCA